MTEARCRRSLPGRALRTAGLLLAAGVSAVGAQQPGGDWSLEKPLTGKALACEKGKIKIFDCSNVELLAYLPQSMIGGAGEYDIWGWTDSATHREFVLATGDDGTAFVEVTDPVNPKYLGFLAVHRTKPVEVPGFPGAVLANKSPGVKVYQNYAFIIAEGAGDQGLQVFDLTQLRDVKNAPVTFQETARYEQLGSAHTLVLNPETGFAYPSGSLAGGETCGGGLHVVDVRTPTKPVFAGCYSDVGYIHDAQCVVYRGPDRKYQGREVCFNAVPGRGVDIVDVTDKKRLEPIGVGSYPDLGYTHQGWLTGDQRYFFVDDEEDPKDKTRTIVFDIERLEDPVVLTTFRGTTNATAHNLYIDGRYMYQSNYTAGLRIIDVADPKQPKEIGYLDTAPYLEGPGATEKTLGSWGNYPFLKDDVVAVASKGLFLVRVKAP